ncbi:MAG: hypothetical protein EAZ95_19165 [Bacteroidetes bacterium]|nr:MAG: hypothetical protein EAZ95_19165 [Bacteroidota bacterium]
MHRLGVDVANHVAAMYQLGTASSTVPGTVIFWGIDAHGQARYGQLANLAQTATGKPPPTMYIDGCTPL